MILCRELSEEEIIDISLKSRNQHGCLDVVKFAAALFEAARVKQQFQD